jgi:predicted RNase H-like nuclease (RuvC/YqgF family)
MKYTLGTAAKATGKSKSTISRDIKNGKISAIHRDNGSYEIDPSELHRVYPAVSCNSSRNGSIEDIETHGTGSESRAIKAEVDGLREQIELLKNERNDLRRRLDQESEERRKLTMMLTHHPQTESHQPEQQVKSLLWKKLFGRR